MNRMIERAAKILGNIDGAVAAESTTGARRSRTPGLLAMSITVKAAGMASILLLADCSAGMTQANGTTGFHIGFDQRQQPQNYGYGALQPTNNGTVEAMTLAGMGAGALIGNNTGSHHGRVLKTIGGALLGGVAGNAFGHMLSPQQSQPGYGGYQGQQGYAQDQNLQQDLARTPIGEAFYHQNPNGDRVTYTPVKEGRDQQGRFCREYRGDVMSAEGFHSVAHGTVCQQSNGYWTVISAAEGRDAHSFAEVTHEIDLDQPQRSLG
jgi:surface antigen